MRGPTLPIRLVRSDLSRIMKCVDPERQCQSEAGGAYENALLGASRPAQTVSFDFGPFSLHPAARILQRDGATVRLAGRALDLLIALVEAAGAVVGKRELMARVWPDTIVEEGSLRFHVMAIRKALGDGAGGTRYVVNSPGRGYAFVAKVTRSGSATSSSDADPSSRIRLPPRQTLSSYGPGTVIGRDQEIALLSETLFKTRCLSIIGPGGIGKTTVAVEIARKLEQEFLDEITFVDLSVVTDATMVAATVAAALGVALQDASLEMTSEQRPFLLVLDCCEHVIEAAAQLSEQLMAKSSGAHLIITSREALRARGELVYRLGPLASPPADTSLELEEALKWPAIRLFIERVEASGTCTPISNADVPSVARLCRQVGGNALAIELVAGRMETFGLQGVIEQLNKHSRLMWQGRRTAAARHQTLNATLDWSYDLLTETERETLNRLAIFVGGFTLDAAFTVAAGNGVEEADLTEALGNLVSKSLINIDAAGEALRYSLLDTTRMYALQKLESGPDLGAVSRRHARWVFDSVVCGKPGGSAGAVGMGNVRAALQWSLSAHNDIETGCALVARAAPNFLAGSLIGECRKWAELALEALPTSLAGSAVECDLHTARGQSAMFVDGNSAEVDCSFARASGIATSLRDRQRQLQLFSVRTLLLQRTGNCRAALHCLNEAYAFLSEDDPQDTACVMSIIGPILYMNGRLSEAKQCWTAVIAWGSRASDAAGATNHGYDPVLKARCGQVASLWLDGRSDAAAEGALDILSQARLLGHHPTFCIVAIWASLVFAWRGEWDVVRRNAKELLQRARACEMTPYTLVARMLDGLALVHEHKVEAGIRVLKDTRSALRACRYEMLIAICEIGLAQGFASLGQHEEALKICEDALDGIDRRGDEIHRVSALVAKANALLGASPCNLDAAIAVMRQARDVASSQQAPAWIDQTELALRRLEQCRSQTTAIDRSLAGLQGHSQANPMLNNI
uniref:ATP-binding protein n=1 Tax=Variovorax sp. BK018 TaxID=3450241 RepID=UPI00403A0ECA